MIRPTSIVALLILLSAAAVQGAEVAAKPLFKEGSIAAYDLAQWSADLGQVYKRPFDLDQIAVDATFTDEAGTKWVMPAFWYDTLVNPTLGGEDTPEAAQWRIRFSPPHAGKWTIAVSAKDKAGTRTSAPVSFEVKPSNNPGLVRRRSDSERYFKFDSGAPFFPVGLNLPFSESKHHLDEYRSRFANLHKAGGNYARVFIFPPYVIESYQSGIGRYDSDASAYYDRVFELARKNDIHLMFTFIGAGPFKPYNGVPGSQQWGNNPYNSANAGPVPYDDMMQFFTNEKARKLYKQFLRYMVARYSSYNALAFWEMWTEQQHVPNIPVAWTREMTSYLREVDPYKHLITNASDPDLGEHWKVPQIDMTQDHLYGHGTEADLSSSVTAAVAYFSQFHKPFLLGEFGITWNWDDPPEKLDTSRKGTGLHNGLWCSTMSGCAGTAMTWWWHYIEDFNLWHLFTPISRFTATIPWSQRDFAPLFVDSPRSRDAAGQGWSDQVLKFNTVGFGLPTVGTVHVTANGQTLPGLQAYLFGPKNAVAHAPIVLSVDLPKATAMLIHLNTVFDAVDLQISVDGKRVDQYQLKVKPGVEAESIKENKTYHIYTAVLNKTRSVDVPAGKHTITIVNMSYGNWVSLDSIIFKGARAPGYTDLETYAIQDAPTGETLLWIRDPQSNWMNDVKGIEPKPQVDALLTIPMPAKAAGAYTAQWWDTRSGKVVREDQAEVDKGVVKLAIPTFTRDIALRLFK